MESIYLCITVNFPVSTTVLVLLSSIININFGSSIGTPVGGEKVGCYK